MAELEIRNLHVQAEDKQILKGVDLTVSPGEIHALMGPNGSGKSTLANAIMGHPSLEVTEGQILFDGEDITEADPDERARMGLFMAFQYPVAIPGVTITKYLRMVMNAHREARGEDEISLKEFRKTVEAAMELTNVPREFISRYLNEGFSGGEKKRLEILQLALQQPKIAILDETDSGLDIDALNVVAHGVNTVAKASDMGVLIITHYQRILHMVAADARVDHVRRPDRQGGRPRARRPARGRGLRLDPRRGRRRPPDGRPAPTPPLAARVPDAGARGRRLPRHRRDVADAARRSSTRWTTTTSTTARSVHRGVYPLAVEATELFEGARERIAACRELAGARRRSSRRTRPRRSTSSRTRGAARTSAPATASSSPRWSTTPTSCRGRCCARRSARRSTIVPSTTRPACDLDELDALLRRRRRQARRRRPRLQRARHDQPGRRDRAPRARRRRGRRRRRLAGRAADPGRRRARSTPTSTPGPATRSTGRPASASCTAAASCSTRCRRSSAAGT